jgi:hypothetical protein
MARGEHDYCTECLQQFKQVAIATHLSLESRPRQLAPSPRAEHSVTRGSEHRARALAAAVGSQYSCAHSEPPPRVARSSLTPQRARI